MSRRSSRAGSFGGANQGSSNAGARGGVIADISSAPIAERVLAQEIEIAAAVGLQDLAAVEPGIAALRHRRRRGPAPRQLLRRDEQVEPSLLDRQADTVAVLHLGERPARCSIGR